MGKPIPFSSIYTPNLRFLVDGDQIDRMYIEAKDKQISAKKYKAQFSKNLPQQQIAAYSLKKGYIGFIFYLERRGKLYFNLDVYTYKEFRAAKILKPAELKRFAGEPPIILNGI